MKDLFDGVYSGVPVLVTGHTGFKGSWLSLWLKELGAEVTGYSLDPPTTLNNFELCGLHEKVADVRGDVRSLDGIKDSIRKYEPQIVFHLAAQPLVITGYCEPKDTFDANAGGVVNILEAIRQTRSVKAVVVVTSDKVYEDSDSVWSYRETDVLGGYDPYSASKAMAELAVQAYRRSWNQQWSGVSSSPQQFSDHPVGIASARAGNVIGGGDFGKYRLIPDCMAALLSKTPLVLRNPNSIRHWQFVLEPLSGYLWLAASLLRDREAFSEAWNFGPLAHEAVTSQAIAERSMELWGSSVPVVHNGALKVHETSVLKVNWEKAETRLYWRPVYSCDDTIAETVNWWKEYSRRLDSEVMPHMYDVCVAQIQRYVERARLDDLRWAAPTMRRIRAGEWPASATERNRKYRNSG